jgi:hypothetical protein
MKSFVGLGLLVSMVGVSGLALAGDAEQAAKPAAPQPPAELADMAKKTKRMTCTGSVMDMQTKQMVESQFTRTAKLDLDKMWIVAALTEKKTKTRPLAYKAHEYLGFKADEKKWNMVSFDNMGGWQQVSAPASPDGTMNWTGNMYTPMGTMKVRYMDKIEGKTGTFTGEMSADGKQWNKFLEYNCKL